MGRRGKRTSRRAKKAAASPSSQNTSPHQVLRRQSLEDYAAELAEDQARELCLDLSEALKQIYGEFVNDLRSRKNKRYSSENPLEHVQDYKLVVQNNYRKQFATKVHNLVCAGYGEEAFEQLRVNIIDFVKSLRDQILEISDAALRVMVLQDSYHTLQNASEEVGRIVKSLFFYEREVNCDNLNKYHFYEQVVKVVNLSLGSLAVPQVEDTLKLEQELKELVPLCCEPHLNFSALSENKVWDFHNFTESEDEELDSRTDVDNMSIDELVMFIEASSTRSSKKKRNKGDSTRSSSPKELVGDREFEELLERLKRVKPAAQKVKPNLKPEWLQSLRRELHKGRN